MAEEEKGHYVISLGLSPEQMGEFTTQLALRGKALILYEADGSVSIATEWTED